MNQPTPCFLDQQGFEWPPQYLIQDTLDQDASIFVARNVDAMIHYLSERLRRYEFPRLCV